jgi:hypothetical protein
MLRLVAQMPFASHVRAVPAIPERLGKSDDTLIEVAFVAGRTLLLGGQQLVHVAETGDVVVRTAHQHRTSG